MQLGTKRKKIFESPILFREADYFPLSFLLGGFLFNQRGAYKKPAFNLGRIK